MTDKLYTYVKRDGEPSALVKLGKVMTIAAIRIVAGRGRFTINVDGKRETKYELRRGKTLRRLRQLCSTLDVGSTARVRNGAKHVIFTVRRAEPAVRIVNTNGNAKADRYWSFAKAKFPFCSFLGSYVCKDIAGTNTLSQHSYGNAVDIGAGSMAALGDIANWAYSERDELDIETIIVGAKIWTRAEGWHSYGGEYHYHVHVDFVPNLSGGCGVRN